MNRQVTLPDGTVLSASITGVGEPMVLCHGGPGLWDYLGSLAELVDDRLQVIRYDQRGCGLSSGADGPYTVGQFVDDLDGLRVALCLDSWWVAGHSWGAQLALRYAVAHPETTRGVIYIGGTGIGAGYRDPHKAESRRRLGSHLPRWEELDGKERSPEEEHELCVLQWATDYSPSVDGAAHAEGLWATKQPGVQINYRCNREVWQDNFGDDDELLARLAVSSTPLHVVHGADDPRPVAATDSLVEANPRFGRTVVAGAGHAPWVERAQVVRDVILGFVAASEEPRRAGAMPN